MIEKAKLIKGLKVLAVFFLVILSFCTVHYWNTGNVSPFFGIAFIIFIVITGALQMFRMKK
ncbi:MAG: hypothetical protein KH135_00490 [Firmicutes bacterium]|nr:hypothetical protein [Bacillota bacterium]